MKKTIYTSYYSCLSLIILSFVINTLFQTSLVVTHGRRQQELKLRQAQLSQQKQLLEEKLALKTSLSLLTQETDLSSYQLITQPIVISASTSLAALN